MWQDLTATSHSLVRENVNSLYGSFSELQRTVNIPDRFHATAFSMDAERAEIENTPDDALINMKTFNTCMIQLKSVPADEPGLGDCAPVCDGQFCRQPLNKGVDQRINTKKRDTKYRAPNQLVSGAADCCPSASSVPDLNPDQEHQTGQYQQCSRRVNNPVNGRAVGDLFTSYQITFDVFHCSCGMHREYMRVGAE